MESYFTSNRLAWNQRLSLHLKSKLYDQENFVAGKNSLFPLDQQLLGSVKGKRILHLQCHFGQDTISLARLGAQVTGLDLSDQCIDYARQMAKNLRLSNVDFLCANVYDFPHSLNGSYDLVYTSYGTIVWLPDLNAWAETIRRALKPGGKLVFVEFHPFIWVYDSKIEHLTYDYFNSGVIHEIEQGSYAAPDAAERIESYTWNHPLSEVITALLQAGLMLNSFLEYDYAPCEFAPNLEEFTPGHFRFKNLTTSFPMVYSIMAEKISA